MVQLETDRLLLREINPDKDFHGYCELMANEQSMRYIGGKSYTREQAWRYMATVMGHWQIRGYGFFSVIEKATDQWIGRVGPWSPLGWPSPEVGWAILASRERNGFASEAAAACVKFAFDELGWTRVIHVIHTQNIGSIKTAEKIGARRTGEIQGIPAVTDELCYIYDQSRA